MTAPLTAKIRDFLGRNGPASAQTVAEAVQEIGTSGGEQRALLLMRLDPQLEPVKGGLWALRGIPDNDDRKVKKVADEYFQSLKRPGAPLSSAVKHIYEQTHIEPPKVEDTLRKYYLIKGTNIYNRPKSKEED